MILQAQETAVETELAIGLNLELLPQTLSICRLSPKEEIPQWAMRSSFFSVSRTPEELSIVCVEDQVPQGIKTERGWRCIKVRGPLDFALTGILASLSLPLAKAKISIFAISTFDTDYLLVKQGDLESAKGILMLAGHRLGGDDGNPITHAPTVIRSHHSQVSIPVGSEEKAKKFYCGVLGLREIEKPDSLKGRGGFWLELGNVQIHFGAEDGVDRKVTKSHVAYEVVGLQGWKARLLNQGTEILDGIPIPGWDRFEFRDPFGNRAEFLERQ